MKLASTTKRRRNFFCRSLLRNILKELGKFEKDVKAWSHFNKKLLLEKAAEADEHRISGKPLGSITWIACSC